MTLDDNALAQLFFAARTHNAWADRPVADELLQRLYDTLKWAPTSANCSPGRFVFVKSAAAKERLRPAMDAGNLDKTMAAPVTVIVATDFAFYEHLGKLFPHAPDARSWFAGKPEAIQTGGFRNGTLQGAYLILAARAGPRLWSDVRLQQRQGRRRVLCRHRDSLELPGQPGLWRHGGPVPAQSTV